MEGKYRNVEQGEISMIQDQDSFDAPPVFGKKLPVGPV
jgi:hypothetical protein